MALDDLHAISKDDRYESLYLKSMVQTYRVTFENWMS